MRRRDYDTLYVRTTVVKKGHLVGEGEIGNGTPGRTIGCDGTVHMHPERERESESERESSRLRRTVALWCHADDISVSKCMPPSAAGVVWSVCLH